MIGRLAHLTKQLCKKIKESLKLQKWQQKKKTFSKEKSFFIEKFLR